MSSIKDIKQDKIKLKEWLLFVLDYFKRVASDKDRPMWDPFVSVVQKVNDKRGLLSMFSDINDAAEGLSARDFVQLNLELKERFGCNLADNDMVRAEFIAKVVKRGRIKSPNEYRKLEERVSDLSQTVPDSEEIELLNSLLIEYYSRTTGTNSVQ